MTILDAVLSVAPGQAWLVVVLLAWCVPWGRLS